MPILHPPKIIPCVVEVPAHLQAPARYALSTLLLPLGIEPGFERGPSEPILYYGVHPESSNAPVRFGCTSRTIEYFRRRTPYEASEVRRSRLAGAEVPVLFPAEDAGPPFDPVASTFFWISGWEEWVSPARDHHGRFRFAASLLSKLDAVDSPPVDHYRSFLAERLAAAGVTHDRLTWGGGTWAFVPTIDVDALYRYRLGTLYRNAVESLTGPGLSPTGRLRKLSRSLIPLRSRDPWMNGLFRILSHLRERRVGGTFFLKCGGSAAEDSGYSPSDRRLRRFARAAIEAGCEIGLHPSYFTPGRPELMRAELESLRASYGPRAGRSARQHYLRYDLQTTPLTHEACGLEIDSTLGFADREGFRRGTSLPFRVYDLVAGRPTRTWEIPLIFMDATLFNYRGLAPDQAVERSIHLMETCRRAGGVCVGLWHNTIFDETGYPGWGDHFVRTLEAAIERGALVTTLEGALSAWLNRSGHEG